MSEGAMRALVVDDSKALRMLMRNILKGLGFEIFEAGHGKEALERLATVGNVDLALVDWNMPEMNGLDLVKALRSDATRDEIKIIMVTTETEMPRMVAALEAGANEYLMKPFTKDALIEKLSMVGFDRA
jgi:two-component system, chemotaxis family, chemotaxis protein CheY